MSLYKQLLIGISLFMLFIFCGNFWSNLETSRQQYHNQLNAHAQDTASALGLSLTPHVDDPAMTELMINSIFDNGYFSRIRIVEIRSGKVLEDRVAEPIIDHVPGWFSKMAALEPGKGEAIIMRGWTQAARVEVESHPSFAINRLWHSALSNALWLFVCSLLLLLVMSLVLRYQLKPLNYLVEQANAITRREFLSLPKLPKTPELRRVVQAMNMMVTQLKALFEEQVKRSETLIREAYHDSLTGVANRRAFDEKFQARLADEESPSGNLILVRIQDLAGVNARKGGAKTDELIVAVSRILTSILARDFKGNGLVARIRGGEFAMLTPQMMELDHDQLMSELSHQLQMLYSTGASDVMPVGHAATVTFNQGDVPGMIMMRADQALTAAETQMNYFAAADVTIAPSADNENRNYWLSLLQEILADRRFVLFSQPVVSCIDPKVIDHHKILARVTNEEGEIIAAGKFMPWVYRLNLGTRMDLVILSQTLDYMTQHDGNYAISIVGESIATPEATDALLALVKNKPELAGRLTFELDENELPDSEVFIQAIKRIKAAGCGIGVQHFGGRFHLIGHLPQWGLSWLKVDGSYVHDMDTQEDKRLFLEALYWATRQINLPLIAERVETQSELEQLSIIGLQGAMGKWCGEPKKIWPL
ncbi:GGDEF domain-containing protein [Salmonella enterica subsp. enterica serovar Choleraesuis]|nr:GGDEF domain-containing protein [Salmonella enterica subsp. enterica serovar Choleraesuis]